MIDSNQPRYRLALFHPELDVWRNMFIDHDLTRYHTRTGMGVDTGAIT